MYYKYNSENSIRIPTPFNRAITPVFMGDDDKITDCAIFCPYDRMGSWLSDRCSLS